MRGPYRTIEDVLRSPWAAIERPGEGSATDRVLRSTRLEDSIYTDLRDEVGKEIDLVTTQTLEQRSTLERTPEFVESVRAEIRRII